MQNFTSIDRFFLHACQQYGGCPAFTCLGHSISYAQLEVLTEQFASYLQHNTTLAPGDRIAIQLPNLLQYPVVLFGALRAGLVVVNTNPLYTERELEHQLNDSGAKVLVVLKNLAKTAEAVVDKTNVQQVILTEVGDLHGFPKRQLINSVLRYIKKEVPHCSFTSSITFRRALKLGAQDPFRPAERQPHDLAFLQYTGGTTGIAKGAMLSHNNLLENMRQSVSAWQSELQPQHETVLAPLPLYHIYGVNSHCFVLFSIGTNSVLIPNPRDLKSMIKVMRDTRFTGMMGINTLFIALMNHPDFGKIDFSHARHFIAGGMALAEDTCRRWADKTGITPAEGYGLTESSPVLSINPPDDIRIGTIGKALPDTELKVISADGENLAANLPGELCARGPQIMPGYWQQPEATAEVIDQEGWLRTGDIATIDEDGFVKIVDRKKDMILVSGFNVYPNEIEEVLLSHPEIIEAAVIGVEDKMTGEAVKAFLVLQEGSALEDEDVISLCREKLTAYKVPKQFEYRDELPKTNVGKVLRRALRQDAGQGTE